MPHLIQIIGTCAGREQGGIGLERLPLVWEGQGAAREKCKKMSTHGCYRRLGIANEVLDWAARSDWGAEQEQQEQEQEQEQDSDDSQAAKTMDQEKNCHTNSFLFYNKPSFGSINQNQ